MQVYISCWILIKCMFLALKLVIISLEETVDACHAKTHTLRKKFCFRIF